MHVEQQPDGSKASVTVGPSSLLGSSGGTRHRRAPSLDEDDYELEREHRPVPQHLPIGRIEAGSKAGIGQYPITASRMMRMTTSA